MYTYRREVYNFVSKTFMIEKPLTMKIDSPYLKQSICQKF